MDWTLENVLRRPSDFGLSSSAKHYDDMFHTWSLGPVIRTRDSSLLEQSNADALEKHLGSLPELEGEWCISGCRHFAVGWVDHISFHAKGDDGEPTRMFEVLKEWFRKLSNYPVADEEDLSQREYNATIENIEEVIRRVQHNDAPEGTAGEVYAWLSDNDPDELEPSDGGGGYPSDAAIENALDELGTWYVIPFVYTYPDDYGYASAMVVHAWNQKQAIERAREAASDDEGEWGLASGVFEGSSVEDAGDDCFYNVAPCDCGDEGCDSETEPHDSQSVTLALRTRETKAFDTREAALAYAQSEYRMTPEVFDAVVWCRN